MENNKHPNEQASGAGKSSDLVPVHGDAFTRKPPECAGRSLWRDERGAITAEYAIVIMAAVAFAGLLVAIIRSDEIRGMLVKLVEDALGAAG